MDFENDGSPMRNGAPWAPLKPLGKTNLNEAQKTNLQQSSMRLRVALGLEEPRTPPATRRPLIAPGAPQRPTKTSLAAAFLNEQ